MNKKKKNFKRPDDNEFKRMSQKWRQWNILFRQRTKVNGLSEGTFRHPSGKAAGGGEGA